MKDFRFMTYNMLHAPGDRLDAIADVIRSVHPDVVACQEVDDIPGFLQLSERVGMPVVFGRCNQPESPPVPEHLAFMSRWPIVKVQVHPGDVTCMFRPVLEVWVEPPESPPIGFFVVHFRAFPGPPGESYKVREARALLKILAGVEEPHVVLGDFNAWSPGEGDLSKDFAATFPKDHRDAIRGGVIQHMLDAGYTDTWRHLAKDGKQVSTWHHSPHSRIDYIWVMPQLVERVTNCEIVRVSSANEASDHYPVVATLNLEAYAVKPAP